MILESKDKYVFDRNADYDGYRNIDTNEWIQPDEFFKRTSQPEEYQLYSNAIDFFANNVNKYDEQKHGKNPTVFFMLEFAKSQAVKKFVETQINLDNAHKTILDEDLLDYEIEDIYNRNINKREKPPKSGVGKFPNNYKLDIWECLRVRRLFDDAIFIKEITHTNKGKVLYFKFTSSKTQKSICLVGTALGEFDIKSLVIVESM